jgi:hypothetical protein
MSLMEYRSPLVAATTIVTVQGVAEEEGKS